MSDVMVEIAKRVTSAESTARDYYTRGEFIAEINKRAEPLRKTGLTEAQAFSKYVSTHADGAILMKASMLAKPDAEPDHEPAASTLSAPASPSLAKLNELAQAVADTTGCTFAQGFAQVLGTAQGAALYQSYVADFRAPWMDTAEAGSRYLQENEVPGSAHLINGTGPAGGAAYGKLMEKAAELQKADPSLSEAVAFTKVFSDPANAALAAQERRENRPT